MRGRLIGVSLGPGDPGLITRRAWEALTSDARWAWPVRRAGGESHALGIARRAGLTEPADGLPLVFPMTYDVAVLARAWARAADAVLPVLRAGRDVAFLVEGDAGTYASFTYLARAVRALDAHVPVEVIPGVTSFQAAAAGLGQPLAETDDAVAIVPAGYGIGELDQLLPHFDTLVLLKVKSLLDAVLDWLKAHGLGDHAVFIEKAGTPEERVVHELETLRGCKVSYLSLMLVRNPGRERGPMIRGCRPKQGDA